MSFLDSLKKQVADKVSSAIKEGMDKVVDSAIGTATAKAADAVTDKITDAVTGIAGAAKKKLEEKAEAAGRKSAEELEAERRRAHEESEHMARTFAQLQGIPLDEAAEGTTAQKLHKSVEAFWQQLHDQWAAQKNEGCVWTITIDSMVELDALGLVKAKYDLDLSASHVGYTMDGVYAGSMAFKFDADLGGLNAMMGALGGHASTGKVDGWFRNDNFVMELKPYNKIKEDAFLSTLNYTSEQLGSLDEDPGAQAQQDLAAAFAKPLTDTIGSKPDDYEKANAPVSYWFDWEYNMTEGDMSQHYAVNGIMGMAGGCGSLDASGEHLEAHGSAVSPFGGVYREDISEDFHSPFPYVVHVYENGRVTFELHSQRGGGVVIVFRGKIDSIPVEQTVIVP